MEIATPDVNFEVLSFERIKELYPDQWVLIGNPVLRDPDVQASVVSKLMSGIVVLHHSDRREIAELARHYRRHYTRFACVWTGVTPQNRRFLL